MANIPFKSITFPGLPNKYTVPEISNDLMTQGKAADAKATGDALALKANQSTTYTKTEVDALIESVDVETDTTLSVSGKPADAKKTGDEISAIKADLADVARYNPTNLLVPYGMPQSDTINGVTFTFNDNTCTAVGTSTSKANINLYYNMFALMNGVEAGKDIYVNVETTDNNLRLAIFFYESGNLISPSNYIISDRVITVPSNAVGMIVRVDVPGNETVNGTISFAILNMQTINDLSKKASSLICAKDATPYVNDGNITLSDLKEDGFYVISLNWTVTDAPSDLTVSGLTVERFSTLHANGFIKQTVENIVTPNTSKRFYRFSNYNGSSWSQWVEFVQETHTNQYTFEEYSQTVNLTASPQITSDTNNYLAPSGDTTDRTADILAMLTSSKICRLGSGDYYISNLQMPDNSALIGSGNGTRIHLKGTSDGFAIKPGSYCILSDFMLQGSNSALTFNETIGGRHGILWQGTYSDNQSAPFMCRISNVLIRDFSGGGITCYDTGYGTFNAIEATNIIILGCWAGLNISYWSEFHKFTNVRCYLCRVGCVNNGGNNVFVNCDFSQSKEICMLMDNSQSQSPNNSHGSCIGCVFNHAYSNDVANSGVGIKILNCANGFIFSGCQIFFSRIRLEDSDGITFANCNFGYSNCDISVSGGKAIIFSSNIHQNTPPITISNDADVHFVNCYNRTTGAVVEPS